MFLSMTGFGRASRVFSWGTVTFEISAVNHRYQEIALRLPKELNALETELLVFLRAALRRGKVRLNAEISWAPEHRTATVDGEALASYIAQLDVIAKRLGTPLKFELTDFLSLPGVCDAPRGGEGCVFDSSWKALAEAAADALMEMKAFEGAKLQESVLRDLEALRRLLRALSDRWDVVAPAALDALKARIEKLAERFGLEVDQARIAQEVALLADKWDVSEELARLESHLRKFADIASGPESEGRKLDFLIQEMNREVNTLGSKVNDAEFRWQVVEAKSCLERMREQIQNIE